MKDLWKILLWPSVLIVFSSGGVIWELRTMTTEVVALRQEVKQHTQSITELTVKWNEIDDLKERIRRLEERLLDDRRYGR